MAITPDQMTKLVKIYMDYTRKEGYKTIHFAPEDAWYQKVWHQDRQLYGNPPISLGYLDEDLAALEKVLSGENVPTAYDLERIGAIFTTLGAIMCGQSAMPKKNNKES